LINTSSSNFYKKIYISISFKKWDKQKITRFTNGFSLNTLLDQEYIFEIINIDSSVMEDMLFSILIIKFAFVKYFTYITIKYKRKKTK